MSRKPTCPVSPLLCRLLTDGKIKELMRLACKWRKKKKKVLEHEMLFLTSSFFMFALFRRNMMKALQSNTADDLKDDCHQIIIPNDCK